MKHLYLSGAINCWIRFDSGQRSSICQEIKGGAMSAMLSLDNETIKSVIRILT